MNIKDLAARILFDQWDDEIGAFAEENLASGPSVSALSKNVYDHTAFWEGRTGSAALVHEDHDLSAGEADRIFYSKEDYGREEAFYIAEKKGRAVGGPGDSRGDTINFNIYGVDDAVTLAEQTAREIERMKERRNAAGG